MMFNTVIASAVLAAVAVAAPAPARHGVQPKVAHNLSYIERLVAAKNSVEAQHCTDETALLQRAAASSSLPTGNISKLDKFYAYFVCNKKVYRIEEKAPGKWGKTSIGLTLNPVGYDSLVDITNPDEITHQAEEALEMLKEAGKVNEQTKFTQLILKNDADIKGGAIYEFIASLTGNMYRIGAASGVIEEVEARTQDQLLWGPSDRPSQKNTKIPHGL